MTNIANHQTLDCEKFMQVSRLTPTTVNIISTNGPGGLVAQTINSVMIASHTPPIVAISVESDSLMSTALLANRSFTVNVLGIHHDAIADNFSQTMQIEQNIAHSEYGRWKFDDTKSRTTTSIQGQNKVAAESEITLGKNGEIPEQMTGEDTENPSPYIPYLHDAVAVLRCEITTTLHMGSNLMYLGEVQDISYQETPALVYHNSHYCSTAVTVPSYFS